MFINIEPILFDIITNYLWITDGLTLLILVHLIFIIESVFLNTLQQSAEVRSPARGRGESQKLKKNLLITACLSPASDDSKLFKDLIKNRQTKIWIQTYKNNFSINFKKIK